MSVENAQKLHLALIFVTKMLQTLQSQHANESSIDTHIHACISAKVFAPRNMLQPNEQYMHLHEPINNEL